MKLTNLQVYQIANGLNSLTESDHYIPAKANFFLQKNMQVIAAAAKEIEESRLKIAQHYGELDEENQQYKIPEENTEAVTKELNDLFNIEQDLDIKTFKIDDLGSAEFTSAQMQAIMFMIED